MYTHRSQYTQIKGKKYVRIIACLDEEFEQLLCPHHKLQPKGKDLMKEVQSSARSLVIAEVTLQGSIP